MYPAITRSGGAITSAAVKVSDRIESRIEIIHVSDNATAVDFWVKNVGVSYIAPIERSDIFFGLQDDFGRVDYGDAGPPFPYWDYHLEGDNSEWGPEVTLNVTIHPASPPSAGTYMIKMVIHNGIYDQTTFGVD